MTSLLLIVLFILGVGPRLASSNHSLTTFNLFYDGILASEESIENLSSRIANDILESYNALQGNNQKGSNSNENQQCNEISGVGSRCAVDIVDVDENLMLHVSTHFSSRNARIDVTLTTSRPPREAREALIQSVSSISTQLGSLESSEPVWSIRHRPTVAEMKVHWDETDSVMTAHEYRNMEEASLETMILANSKLRNRTRLARETSLEVWQYNDVDFLEPIRALFLDGILLTTTSPCSAAHAEALAHPALIAHGEPKSVLVVSKTPSTIVKEVLKHKSVSHVSVVGADNAATQMVQTFMPSLNECTFLGNLTSHCLQQERVNVIEEDFLQWLFSSVETTRRNEALDHQLFDVILVDVPVATEDWLSLDLYQAIDELLGSDEAIVVLSTGSRPTLFEVDSETKLSARETLLRNAARKTEDGGLDLESTHIYDEPLAKPLSSTFVAFFYSEERESYARFIRKNSPMIDIEMVNRLWPHTRTKVYDGPTHAGYIRPSRVWENHFCKTIPGRNLPICQSVLADWMDISFHHRDVEVRKDPVKGRTVYATEDIPKDHFINPQDASLGWRLERDQWKALNKFVNDYPEADMYRQLREFLLAYGFEQQDLGIDGWGVSLACTNTFVNHACSSSEDNTSWLKPAFEHEYGKDGAAYSPPFVRRAEIFAQLTVASRDIKAGEEILQNYYSFRVNPDDEYKKLLKRMCEEGSGLVENTVGGDEL